MPGDAPAGGTSLPSRILVLGVYPIARPRYGGPLRSRAVVSALRGAFAEVTYVGVCARFGGALPGPGDILVSPDTNLEIMERPYLADVICGTAIHSDPHVKRRLANVLTKIRPHVIVLEQLYPYLGLRPLLDEVGLRPTLVYDAHNVEHDMKAGMYASLVSDPSVASAIVETIRRAEASLAGESAMTAAVTEGDADAFRMMGAARVIVAPNGTSPIEPSRPAINRHRAFLAHRRITETMVFVSSAHEPNWRSFLDFVGTKLGFVPPSARILLCGGVSDLAQRTDVAASDIENVTFWQRVIAMGHLSEDDLAAVLVSARAILLPVSQGGGSNLKTAEALASGRRVVATSFAFRGYEGFANIDGVTIADTADEFRRAMAATAHEPTLSRSRRDEDRLRQLYWPARLSPLVEGMVDVAREAHLG